MRTLLILAGLLAAAPAYANSPELQAVAIPASTCQLSYVYPGSAKPKFGGSVWYLSANGRVLITCPIPVAGRPGVTIDSFRLLYDDPDGRGGAASVKASVRVLRLEPSNHTMAVIGGCDFASNFHGSVTPGSALASFSCPAHTISPGEYAMVEIELWRRSPAGAVFSPSFAGIDFP
jgi:hypothetical protein